MMDQAPMYCAEPEKSREEKRAEFANRFAVGFRDLDAEVGIEGSVKGLRKLWESRKRSKAMNERQRDEQFEYCLSVLERFATTRNP